MKFSYIIPALNEEKYIGKCINSINKQALLPFEIIVVDNGSTDRTKEFARLRNAKVIYETKKGISNARNRGAEVAKGDILCFIDADSTLSKNWAKKAGIHFQNDKVSAVSGTVVYTNNNPLKIAWYNTYILLVYIWVFLSNLIFGKLYLSAGNTAIRKTVFEKLGGFDPVVGEDIYLARKFWKGKYKGVYDIGMFVFSSTRGFDKRGFLQTIFYWFKSLFIKIDQSGYTYKSKV